MKVQAWVALGLAASTLLSAGSSEACGGGGIVSSRPGSVGADAQRVLLSVHLQGSAGGTQVTTDVITQIAVPDTTDNYGALLPLPSAPTLDPNPVSESDLELLDEVTAPQVVHSEGSSDSGWGCGCMGASSTADKGGGDGAGARVSEPVNIGPVTAVVLSGSTEAVNTWLTDNGFVISAADQTTLASYVGYHFVAIRRNQAAAPGGPTSVGVHFSMAGDHREVPLRFASLGAAPTVAITLFLAVAELAGPSPPFAALTLGDLDRELLRSGNYRKAVQDAVGARGNQAFVLESRSERELLWKLNDTRIGALLDKDSTLTRMSTIVPAAALTQDALFHTPYEGNVPNERYVSNTRPLGSRDVSMGSLVALFLMGAWRRRP